MLSLKGIKKVYFLISFLLLICLFSTCRAPYASKLSDKDLLDFSFKQEYNSAILGYDLKGIIEDATVFIYLPSSIALPVELVPSFQSNGAAVFIHNDTPFLSEEGIYRFQDLEKITIRAEDWSTRTYWIKFIYADARLSFSSFSFLAKDNDVLASDCHGIIQGDRINVLLPYNTDRSALRAHFISSADSILYDNKEQESSVTVNDFSQALTYTIKTREGLIKNYTIRALFSLNSEKNIESFCFSTEANPLLERDYPALDYGEDQIIVYLPQEYSGTALYPEIQLSEEAIITPQGSAFNFTNPEYLVIAENGESRLWHINIIHNALPAFHYLSPYEFVSPAAALENPFSLEVLFNMDVSAFTKDDLVLENAECIDFTPLSASRYQLSLQLVDNTMASLFIPADICEDNWGISNSASLKKELIFDNIAPSPGAGGVINIDGITVDRIIYSWQEAHDTALGSDVLHYKLVLSSSNNIGSIAEADISASSGTKVLAYDWGLNPGSYSTNSLAPGLYYFTVLVRDAGGNISQYPPVSARIDNLAPLPGDSGQITISVQSDDSVQCSWTAATDPDSPDDFDYKLVYSTLNNITTVNDANIDADGYGKVLAYDWGDIPSSVLLSPLSQGQTYYMTVLVRDLGENIAQYQVKQLDFDTIPPVPGASALISLEAKLPNSLAFSFIEATDNVSLPSDLDYKIVYSTSNNISTIADADIDTEGDGKVIFSDWGPLSSPFSINGLNENTDYYSTLLVRDKAGNISQYPPVLNTTTVQSLMVLSFAALSDAVIDLSQSDDLVYSSADSFNISVIQTDFDVYLWYLDGSSLANTRDTLVDCAPLSPGVHSLTSVVLKNGKSYSKTIRFTITTDYDKSIIYVDQAASGYPTGRSWKDAFRSLQMALDYAESGSQIWVKAGRYVPTAKYGGLNRQYMSFQLKNGVELYGGFDGTETALDQRDLSANITVLTGDLDGDDSLGPQGESVIINGTNTYHVINQPFYLDPAKTRIDGFLITGGFANGGGYFDYGGGMSSLNGCPSISNCAFIGNMANSDSGALDIEDSTLDTVYIENCLFKNNYSILGNGGVSYLYNAYYLVFNNCMFMNNEAQVGQSGAVYIYFGSVEFNNCVFGYNTAASKASHLGVYFSTSSTVIRNSTFFEGLVTDITGGAILADSSATVDCVNSIVYNNRNTSGWKSFFNISSSITVDYSNIQGGFLGSFNVDVPCAFNPDGSMDPAFVPIEVKEGGRQLTALELSYFPQNTFGEATDIEGVIYRYANLRWGMGAYEYD